MSERPACVNPALHDPRPEHIRRLVGRTGLSIPKAAAAIGIPARTLRDYCNGTTRASYPTQFTLECLAAQEDVT